MTFDDALDEMLGIFEDGHLDCARDAVINYGCDAGNRLVNLMKYLYENQHERKTAGTVTFTIKSMPKPEPVVISDEGVEVEGSKFDFGG